MRAAVVEELGAPLALREWDVPIVGAGQILVKTEACGVCHTDLHAVRGDWPTKPGLPFIPGHEGTQGVRMTRKRGTCVLVGLPTGEFPFPLFDVVANCITIRGSFVGSRLDMAEALAFAAEGKVKADIEVQPLEAINAVLDRLERGEVASRVVLEFPGG